MKLGRFYILKGRQVIPAAGVLAWARWFESADRKIAITSFPGGTVSTVFLGADHQFGDGPPLLFETMIFGGPHDQYQERYATYEEAEAGHARAVALARCGAQAG